MLKFEIYVLSFNFCVAKILLYPFQYAHSSIILLGKRLYSSNKFPEFAHLQHNLRHKPHLNSFQYITRVSRFNCFSFSQISLDWRGRKTDFCANWKYLFIGFHSITPPKFFWIGQKVKRIHPYKNHKVHMKDTLAA